MKSSTYAKDNHQLKNGNVTRAEDNEEDGYVPIQR